MDRHRGLDAVLARGTIDGCGRDAAPGGTWRRSQDLIERRGHAADGGGGSWMVGEFFAERTGRLAGGRQILFGTERRCERQGSLQLHGAPWRGVPRGQRGSPVPGGEGREAGRQELQGTERDRHGERPEAECPFADRAPGYDCAAGEIGCGPARGTRSGRAEDGAGRARKVEILPAAAFQAASPPLALDHRKSGGAATSPAVTEFSSMYARMRSNSTSDHVIVALVLPKCSAVGAQYL